MLTRLALIGGEEFADGFEDVHAGLLAGLNGRRRVVFLPTCAADDGPEAVDYWRKLARERLAAIDAEVEAPRVVDAASANDPRNAQLVAEADWVYLGGGYPHVAMRILPNTRVMEALQSARARGALISGASAGAMLTCEQSWVITPELVAAFEQWVTGNLPAGWRLPLPQPLACLGWLPRAICLPHFHLAFTQLLLERGALPSGFTLIGVEEQTALVQKDAAWEVRGRGAVTLIRDDLKPARYAAGETLTL